MDDPRQPGTGASRDGILASLPQQVRDLQEHVRRLEAELRAAAGANSDLRADIILMRTQMEEAHQHRQRVMTLVREAENEVTHGLIEAQTTIVEAVQEARVEFRTRMRVHAALDLVLLSVVIVGVFTLVVGA